MEPQQAMGFAHFLAQTDTLAKTLLVMLLVMSVATWFLIVTKTWAWLTMRRRTGRFLDTFWNSPSLQAVATHLEDKHPDEPFSHLAYHATHLDPYSTGDAVALVVSLSLAVAAAIAALAGPEERSAGLAEVADRGRGG